MALIETLQRAQPMAQAILDDDSVVDHVRRAGTASQTRLAGAAPPTAVPRTGGRCKPAPRACARCAPPSQVVEAEQRRVAAASERGASCSP